MASIENASNAPASPPSNFPQNPEDFDADPRISFSKLESKFILETGNGEEFEFDDRLKRWVPVVRPHPFTNNEGYSWSMDNTPYNVTDGQF